MKEELNVCGYNDSPVYIPDEAECDSCDFIEERVSAVEQCCEDSKESIESLQYQIDHIQGDDKTYVHNQQTSQISWYVVHNLNKYPSVTVVDSSGTEVIGDVEYMGLNAVNLSFSGAFSGKAYFN